MMSKEGNWLKEDLKKAEAKILELRAEINELSERAERAAHLSVEVESLRLENKRLAAPIPNANLLAIIAGYLKAHGYDGLYQPNECACLLDGLFPCDCPGLDCRPGYLESRGDDGNFRIGPEKK